MKDIMLGLISSLFMVIGGVLIASSVLWMVRYAVSSRAVDASTVAGMIECAESDYNGNGGGNASRLMIMKKFLKDGKVDYFELKEWNDYNANQKLPNDQAKVNEFVRKYNP